MGVLHSPGALPGKANFLRPNMCLLGYIHTSLMVPEGRMVRVDVLVGKTYREKSGYGVRVSAYRVCKNNAMIGVQ